MSERKGVLHGVKIVEMGGLGPAPFCAMVLADHGADVIRVMRPGQKTVLPISPAYDILNRSRPMVELNLKSQDDQKILWSLIEKADALIEGFRPGVMEKMGFGPEETLKRNPKLVFGRMTGWGQTGPLTMTAGHDMNYAGLTGAIYAIGEADRPPPPPLNLVADFGGGAMVLAFGVVAALLEAAHSGKGQVVDAAMTDGVSYLMAMMYGQYAAGAWGLSRSDNLLDGGAPFYSAYRTKDDQFLSVCPLEPQFFAELRDKLGKNDDPDFQRQNHRATWPAMRAKLVRIFESKTRAEWEAFFKDSDACVAPILTMKEAMEAPHNGARGAFVEVDGIKQPAPAPRFSRTAFDTPTPVALEPVKGEDALKLWNI